MGETYDRKRLIRREVEVARRALSTDHVERCSALACRRVIDLACFAAARHVVTYGAIQNEIDPMLIAKAAAATGKQLYLPAPKGERLDFVAMGSPGSTLPPGADGILFVVPGVAFDERGARLGRGGGWYDGALARHPAGVRIGLAYDFQIMPLLPRTDRDIPMHVVVTESRLIGGPAGGQRAAKENQS